MKRMDDLGRRNAGLHAVKRSEEYPAIRVDDEHGRLRDPAAFARVEAAPFARDAAIRVAQNAKRQLELTA
ncbi:MAG TPA: hypothetical protein VFF63_00785 [Candidatus Babeliales bacterium]|nr:hypothetical protein [Candidatus Babeliales bacterium]